MDSMYENIGKKIKLLAKVIFILESIPSVVVGLVFLIGSWINPGFALIIGVPLSLLIMFLGPLFAWISSWLLYGFGELIDKACDIALFVRQTKPISYIDVVADTVADGYAYVTCPNCKRNISFRKTQEYGQCLFCHTNLHIKTE